MNEYQIVILIGLALFCSVVLSLVVSEIVQSVFAFINDSEKSKHNFAAKNICRLFGLKYKSGDVCYRGEGWYSMSSGYGPICLFSAFMFAFPIVLLIAFKLYVLTLSALSFVALMYLTRLVVRGKKLFNKHLVDKKAHQ